MNEFLQALTDPDMAFLRYALIAGLLSSISFGIVGTYVVVRRISYLAGAIAHSVLGGIGLAVYLNKAHGLSWCHPILGAVVAALGAAITIGLIRLRGEGREDTIIGAIWSIGMATGLLFFAITPGYTDPMSYLFGNILLIGRGDLAWVVGLDLLVATLAVIFYNRFLAVCFDEEFAQLRGIKSGVYYILLLCLTALTIVLLVQLVGVIMVIAMLTLPAAISGRFTNRLGPMMVSAIGLSAIFIMVGFALSYQWDLPTGPVIILVAGVVYIATVAIKRR